MTESNDYFIKICGVTNLDDAESIIDAGASGIGLILAESPRRLSIEAATSLADATKGRIDRTAVFFHNDDAFILATVETLGVEGVQIHGALSDELLVGLRRRNVRIVKALSITNGEFLDFDDARVDAVLVDGASPGSGRTHTWSPMSTRAFRVPVIVAGGLTALNVAETIECTRPWGVDTASGVERSPGLKDPTLVSRFVDAARRAFEQREDVG